MELLTVAETAKLLRLSRSQVYVLAAKKQIPHIRVGKRIVIPKTALESWLTKQPGQIETVSL